MRWASRPRMADGRKSNGTRGTVLTRVDSLLTDPRGLPADSPLGPPFPRGAHLQVARVGADPCGLPADSPLGPPFPRGAHLQVARVVGSSQLLAAPFGRISRSQQDPPHPEMPDEEQAPVPREDPQLTPSGSHGVKTHPLLKLGQLWCSFGSRTPCGMRLSRVST